MESIVSPEATTFSNVTMYQGGGMFGIARVDCKSLKVTPNQKYAQYNDAIRVEYVEKGKRKPVAFMLTYDPWVRVVAAKDAIDPAPSLIKLDDGKGAVSCSRSRYSSCDSRWRTDFEDLLKTSNTPILYAVGEGKRETV